MDSNKLKINEIDYDIVDSNVGDLSSLTTTHKNNIVEAINEVKAETGVGLKPGDEICKINGTSVKFGESVSISGIVANENAGEISVNENGLYFIDDSGNVLMSYTDEGFNIAKYNYEGGDELKKPWHPMDGKRLIVIGDNTNWIEKIGQEHSSEVVKKAYNYQFTADDFTPLESLGMYIVVCLKRNTLNSNTSNIVTYLTHLATTFPAAHILFVLPFRTALEQNADQYQEYITRAQSQNIQFYNPMKEGSIRAWNDNFKSTFMKSGSSEELNDKGIEFFNNCMENVLRYI